MPATGVVDGILWGVSKYPLNYLYGARATRLTNYDLEGTHKPPKMSKESQIKEKVQDIGWQSLPEVTRLRHIP